MTHRILKFIGKYHKAFVLRLPKAAKVLSVQPQMDRATLWVAVDSSVPPDQYVNRVFISFATGEEIIDIVDYQYLTTLQDHHGCVWHFFECIK